MKEEDPDKYQRVLESLKKGVLLSPDEKSIFEEESSKGVVGKGVGVLGKGVKDQNLDVKGFGEKGLEGGDKKNRLNEEKEPDNENDPSDENGPGDEKGSVEKNSQDEKNGQDEKNKVKEQDSSVLKRLTSAKTVPPDVLILQNHKKKSRKYTFNDFVLHLNARFKRLASILQNRQELRGAIAISRAERLSPRERVAIIGMINEKHVTKKKNIFLTIEDKTGFIRVLVTQRNKDVFNMANDLVLDEVIGIVGSKGDGVVFADNILFPDIPPTHELKKAPEEEYLAIIGDPQVGSKTFLAKDFEKFISWINGGLGNEVQRAISAKVKYVVVIGDMVEGVGVYPGQEKNLIIKDIKEQYAFFASLMKRIPKHIRIFCIPGNHDAGRISEPQPPIYKDFARELYEMENLFMLSSPSLISVGVGDGFEGISLLLYHGYSLIYYANNVPSIRERGGQKRSELIMKFLLQRRHLAPTHTSNLYVPDPEEDALLITKIPDIFITGHIHRVASAQYRGITMINGSSWSDISEDQEKRGLEPQPARVPVVNLQTRDVKVINFYSGKQGGGSSKEGSTSDSPNKEEGEGVRKGDYKEVGR